MARFLLKRTLSSLITLFLFLTLLFFAAQILMPGDFASQFAGTGMTAAEIAEIRRQLGLDLPLWQQYYAWFSGLLRGNLGMSYTGVSVLDLLKGMLPFTLLIFCTGTALAFWFGQWLGRVVGWRKPGLFSGAVTFGSIVLYTSFPPWLAFLMLYFFGRRLNWLRSALQSSDPRNAGRTSLSPQAVIWLMIGVFIAVALILAGLNWVLRRFSRRHIPALLGALFLVAGQIGGWYALGFGAEAMDIIYFACLPTVTYALLSFGEIMLLTRTNMMDTLYEDYVQVARAKGLPERVVRDKHAARNVVLPVLSRLVINLPYLVTGLAFIEYSFGLSGLGGVGLYDTMFNIHNLYWPGLGSTIYVALSRQDMPLVMGSLLVVGLLSMAGRLFLEVMYVVLDPRLRHAVYASGGIE